MKKPIRIAPFPDIEGYMVREGERQASVSIIQIMLEALRLYYDTFGALPQSGVYDRDTVEAVKEFQRINRIPVTGEIDLNTWNALAEEFNSAMWESQ